MSTIPKLHLKYAWDDGKSSGPTYDSLDEALKAPIRHRAYPLLRLYVDPDGRIVHTEVVA